jgi:RNA polymerase sigma-70 factor (ECF subfamily)
MPPDVRKDGPSDKTMVRRARQGDRRPFLMLLRRYDPRLRRLALRLLADPRRVDRVLTRAYLKAWRNLPFLERGVPPARWLYRIVYNTCINEMRWEPEREPPPPPDGSPVPLPATSEERRLLGLRALKAAERIPLVLVDGEGFSLQDTARIMRRPQADVALDLDRARSRWRSYVLGQPDPLPAPTVLPEMEPVGGRSETADEPPGSQESTRGPAATRAALATLAKPSVPREPSGHVRLLSETNGGLTPRPPSAARRYPDDRRRGRRPGSDGSPGRDGETGNRITGPEEVVIVRPDRQADPEPPARDKRPPRGGTGARRKRRRDAKRDTRNRAKRTGGAKHSRNHDRASAAGDRNVGSDGADEAP